MSINNKIIIKFKEKAKSFLEGDLTVWWALTVNLVLFNVSMGAHPFSETGDDDILMAMVSGCFGESTAHLIFINICWAAVLRILLIIFPGINWYFLLQYVLLFAAFFTIFSVVSKLFGERNGALLSILLLIPFAFEGYVAFQFTKTAGILAAAGCFYLYDRMWNGAAGASCIWGVLLVWLGSCYRFAMAVLVAAMCAGSMIGSFFVDCFYQKKRISLSDRTKSKIFLFGILFLGMLGLRGINDMMYQSQEWQTFHEFNYYRGLVRDFPIHEFEENEQAYARIGVTRAEYRNLLNWNIADPEVYTAEKLKDICYLENEAGQTARISRASIPGVFQFLTGSFAKNKMFVLFWIFSVLFLLSAVRKGRYFADIIVNFSIVLAVNIIFYLRGRYGINRVDICIWLTAVLMLFVAADKDLAKADNMSQERKCQWNLYGFLGICIVIAGMTGKDLKQHLEIWTTERQIQADYQEILTYIDADRKGHYFMDASAAHYGYGTLWFQCYPKEYCTNLIYLGGWYTNSPVTRKQWAQNGIENPFRDMCELENAYIVDRYNHIETTLTYLQEHYERRIETELVFVSGEYRIYSISVS